MSQKRLVEVFSAGCGVCNDAIELVERLACDSCDVQVLDMSDVSVADRARQLGIRSVPAIVIAGSLATCCAGRGPDEATLRAEGIGHVRTEDVRSSPWPAQVRATEIALAVKWDKAGGVKARVAGRVTATGTVTVLTVGTALRLRKPPVPAPRK